MLRQKSLISRSVSLVAVVAVALVAGCSAASPSPPTAGPAVKSESPSPVAGQQNTGAAPAKPVAAQPKVQRLVMAVTPPAQESNELRNMSSPEIWPFRSVYEYPIAVDPMTMKFV